MNTTPRSFLRSRPLLTGGLLLLAAGLVAASTTHAQTLLNGSWESPAVTTLTPGGGDNWTPVGTTYLVPNSSFFGTTPDGNQFLGLNTQTSDAQTVASGFDIGARYHFSVDCANIFTANTDNLLITVSGGATATQTFTIPTRTNVQTDPLPLMTYSLDFTATTTDPITITLAAVGTGNGGLALDNAMLSPVPEPSTWAALLGGAGLLGVVGRARRARRA